MRKFSMLVAGAAMIAFAAPTVVQAQDKDIVETAVAAGSFKTLATALTAAGLIETLKGPGPFTVFAPTDEAFAKIPKAQLDALPFSPRRYTNDVAVRLAQELTALAPGDLNRILGILGEPGYGG